MIKKKPTKNPTLKKIPKVLNPGKVTFIELPLDHPVYTEGLTVVGGRITRGSLIEVTIGVGPS